MNTALTITGLGALSRLGDSIAAHRQALLSPAPPFSALGELEEISADFATTPAAWISPRSLLCHRKWSPASMAALHVARQAIADAQWSPADCRDAAIFFGTSRGGLSGWLTSWPGRRPLPLMQASNSLPSEPAAAIATEHGILSPWHIHASGCVAGLDALDHAALSLLAGKCQRALVVACDLPLVEPLLHAYRQTGILASPQQPGMIPAEAAAALCLETPSPQQTCPQLVTTSSTLEPNALLGTAESLPALTRLLEHAARQFGPPQLCIPHDSGTAKHHRAEPAAIRAALGDTPTFSIKPFTGHAIGASGLIESAILSDWLRAPDTSPVPLHPTQPIFKIASALGGKHQLAIFQPHQLSS